MNLTKLFHPAVEQWFSRRFTQPTPAQAQAWPPIKAGRHTLIAAPTGSGKTLAAFLAAIDDLVRQRIEGPLADATQVVYVSPLKALSNDIRRNLEAPLAGIRAELRRSGLPDVEIRTWVRTGDTSSSERERMRRRPPHILVTTPESLYVLLGSESGRKMLATTRSVIVDEIHAVAPNKRGAHLSLSLGRLATLCGQKLQRIGLSATQNPIQSIGRLLVGSGRDGAGGLTVVDIGYQRNRNLQLEVPGSPLEAVMSGEVWQEVYERLTRLIEEHRTTLVFVNTRRMAERVAREMSERLGDGAVTAQHGSMARDQRLSAEQRLKHGKLKALVATASQRHKNPDKSVNQILKLAGKLALPDNIPLLPRLRALARAFQSEILTALIVRHVYATACAFRFLRQPSRPNAPMPVAHNGGAIGTGVATGTGTSPRSRYSGHD